MTESVNPVLSQVEDLIERGLFAPLVDAEMTALGINFWPLNVIVHKIFDGFYAKLNMFADVGAIKIFNAEHAKALTSADVTLKIIALDKGINSDEYKNARENALLALSRYTRINS